MATNLQTIFSGAFSWMKRFKFWLKFHWSLFLRVQLTISWSGDKPSSEPMMVCLLMHTCITRHQWVKYKLDNSIGMRWWGSIVFVAWSNFLAPSDAWLDVLMVHKHYNSMLFNQNCTVFATTANIAALLGHRSVVSTSCWHSTNEELIGIYLMDFHFQATLKLTAVCFAFFVWYLPISLWISMNYQLVFFPFACFNSIQQYDTSVALGK